MRAYRQFFTMHIAEEQAGWVLLTGTKAGNSLDYGHGAHH
jgi:hypothetical protein